MTTAKRIALSALCLVLVAAATLLAVFLLGKGTPVYAAGAFTYDGSIRAEGGSTEGGRRGLRLYGYDSGATARFRNTQTDVFSAELQFGSHNGRSDLKKYSLVFTDLRSGKQFAVQVTSYSDHCDVGVVYGGQKGGVVYLERRNAAYGLTAGYNADGTYTRFSSEICSLSFDPAAMQVRVKADDGNYRVVWDFTRQYNDGKRLENDLPRFGEYTVSVVFDEIPANSRGDLMLYSFGGYSLTDETVSYRPAILLTKGLRPVAGEAFALPAARVADAGGKDASSKIRAVVYDEDGTVLAENVTEFTPQKAGVLYVYYAYEDGEEKADLWYRTVVMDPAAIGAKFTLDGELPSSVGAGAKFTIPKASVASDLLEAGSEDCLVTLYKDGKVMDGCRNVPAGFVFEAAEPGNYEVVYGGVLSGTYRTERHAFTADAGKLAVNVEIPDGFAKGTVYRFPAAGFCLGTARAEAAATVVFPSGRQETGDVTLDEVGKYTVRYRATVGGTGYTHEKTFTVRAPHTSDFDGGAPAYAQMRGNNEYSGVRLSLSDNMTVTYKKTIDLSDFTFDGTANTGKTLLELNFDPGTIGSTDIDSFFVVLTDPHDPTNYISIRLKYLNYAPTATFIRARSSNQANWVGYYYDFSSVDMRTDAASTHEEGGFVSSASFTHKLDEYDFGYNSLKLYFDYATKCLYAQPMWLTGHDDGTHPEYNSRTVPWLVYDFDATDGALSAGNKPWDGFTTGEAVLSVYAKGISGTTDVFVRNVGGEDLTTPLFDDRKSPVLTVDADRDDIPTAKVGTPYRVFDFTAVDADSPIIDKGVIVTRDVTGREVSLDASGCFTPLEGTYTLTYYAVDAFGYRTEEKISVTAARNVEEPQITLTGELPRTAVYGQTVTLPGYDIPSAGAGKAAVTITVTCGDVTIPVTGGRFDCLGATGVYRVVYTVTDYIGQTTRAEKKISVSLSQQLQFDEETISLPCAFLAGDKIFFGRYTAVYYNEKLEKVTVPATVTVTDGSGKTTIAPGEAYVPTVSGGVTEAVVTFSFASDGRTLTVTRTVPIQKTENGDDFMAGYFVTDNAAFSSSSNGLVFTPAAAGAEMRFSFVRPVWAGQMQLRFIADAKTFGASSFAVTMTDSLDGRQKVTLRYTLVRGLWYCAVEGGKPTATDFDGDGYLSLSYDNATRTFSDASGRALGTVSEAGDRSFAGFTSGYAYVDCVLSGTADTAVGLRTINNQTVNSVKRDMQRPYLKADGRYEGRVAAGTTITLLPATAYDVLNALGDITVSVKVGNKTVLAEHVLVPGETFVASECGTYTILYRVTDAAGNSVPEKIEFASYDPVKPTLRFDGTAGGEARIGQTVQLPSYTVVDDLPGSVTVYRYLLSPDGTKEKITGDSVVFTQAGTYTVTYLVTDAHGNVTLYRFVVTVR